MTQFNSLRKFKDADFRPRPMNSDNWVRVKRSELYSLLKTPYKKKWWCWHSWVYWKFGDATKPHRICKNCNKRQVNKDVLGYSNRWYEDVSVDRLQNYINRLSDEPSDT